MELLIPELVTAGKTQPTAAGKKKDTCHMLPSKNASSSGDLPTAFLVSCMRCGSTWQYQYAEAHPCMRGARPPQALLANDGFCWRNDCTKEVSFFDRKERYMRGLDYYSKYYPRDMCGNSRPCLRVDGTPGYLSSWQAPMRLNHTYSMVGMKHAVKVVKGAQVTVHATGVVQQTGKKFWSTKDPGQQPFSYKAGVGTVILD